MFFHSLVFFLKFYPYTVASAS